MNRIIISKDVLDMAGIAHESISEEFWYGLKSNDLIVQELTKVLDKCLEKTDLKNASYLSLGTQINKYIKEVGGYPEFVTMELLKNEAKEITEIKCTVRSILNPKKPTLINFSKKFS